MASKLPPGAKSEKTKTGPPPAEKRSAEGADGDGPIRPFRGRVRYNYPIPDVAGYDFPPSYGSWEDELPGEVKMPKGRKLSNGHKR